MMNQNKTTGQNETSSFKMEEQDQANVILSELKRIAAEYTTAALEANHPQVRNQFTALLNQTLKHQAELYEAIRSQNAYGSIPMATGQEVQAESQKQIKAASKLRALVHQFTSGTVNAGSSIQGSSHFAQAGSVTVDEAAQQDSLTNTEGPLAQGQTYAQAQGSSSPKGSGSVHPAGTEVSAFSASRAAEAEAHRLSGQVDPAIPQQSEGESMKPQLGAVLTQQLYPNAVYQPYSSQEAPVTTGHAAASYQSHSPYTGSGQDSSASGIPQRGITRPGQPAGTAFQNPSYPVTGHASSAYTSYGGGIGAGSGAMHTPYGYQPQAGPSTGRSGGMQPMPPYGGPSGRYMP